MNLFFKASDTYGTKITCGPVGGPTAVGRRGYGATGLVPFHVRYRRNRNSSRRRRHVDAAKLEAVENFAGRTNSIPTYHLHTQLYATMREPRAGAITVIEYWKQY